MNETSIAVTAIADGEIKFADVVEGYGGIVVIEHNLPGEETICSVYGHLSMKHIAKKGKVFQGDFLSYLANAGETWDGKVLDIGDARHLHFGIRKGSFSNSRDSDNGWRYRGYSKSSLMSDWIAPTEFLVSKANYTRIRIGNRVDTTSLTPTYATPFSGAAIQIAAGSSGTVVGRPQLAFDDGVPSGAPHEANRESYLFWPVRWDASGQTSWAPDQNLQRFEAASILSILPPESGIYPGDEAEVTAVITTRVGTGNYILSISITEGINDLVTSSQSINLSSNRQYTVSQTIPIPTQIDPGLYGVNAVLYRDYDGDGQVDEGDYHASELSLNRLFAVNGSSDSGVGGGGEGGTPDLVLDEIIVKDDDNEGLPGNDNGIVEAGEQIDIDLRIKNEGNEIAESVRASLGVHSQTVEIADDDFIVGDIAPGDDILDGAFRITIPHDLDDESIKITIYLEADNGEWSFEDHLAIESPQPPTTKLIRSSLSVPRISPGNTLSVRSLANTEVNEPVIARVNLVPAAPQGSPITDSLRGDSKPVIADADGYVACINNIEIPLEFGLQAMDIHTALFWDKDKNGRISELDVILDSGTIRAALLIDPWILRLINPVRDSAIRLPYAFRWDAPEGSPPVLIAFQTLDGDHSVFGEVTEDGLHIVSPQGWNQVVNSLGAAPSYMWTLVEAHDDGSHGRPLAPWRKFFVLNGTAPSYQQWSRYHFGPGPVADPNADNDADGLPNILEYTSLHSPAHDSSASHPRVVRMQNSNGEDILVFEHLQLTGASDVTYAVGVARSLEGPWDWTGAQLVPLSPPQPRAEGRLEVMRWIPKPTLFQSKTLFFNLRVEYRPF